MDSLSGVNVLHVDDEADFVELAADMLEREDDQFNVETVTSASEGITQLRNTDYDCVVSDYDMPGKNGIDFLDAVREDYPNLPFILFTGKGDEEIASDAISAGVTEYLQKGTGTSQYTVLANRIRNAVEKYHAQTKLADREQRLNLFFEQSPLGFIEWDENFDIVRANDAAENILGRDEDDLAGCSWEVIVPESDQESVDDVVSSLLENKGGYRSINQNVRGDGGHVICEWHNRVVTDEVGEVVAIFSQFQDITERKERQRRFEAVFNNSYTLAGLLEPDGTILEVNDTTLSFSGLERDDVVGKCLWDIPWVQSNDEVQATIREAIEQACNGNLFRDEIRVQGADREAIIDFSVRPVTDEQGEVRLLVPEGRDITERREQERESERQRRRLKQILKSVPACVVQLNTSGEFVFANQRAEEVLGLNPTDVTGLEYNDPEWNLRDLDGNPLPDDELPFRKVCDTGEPVHDIRHMIERPDGTHEILSVSGAPIFGDDGTIENVIFALTDVTERVTREKRFEAMLENTVAPLFMKDRDGEYLLVNRGWRQLFGLEDTKVRGRTDTDLFSEKTATEVQANDRYVLETGKPVEEEENIMVSGEERTFLTSKTPVYDIGTDSDPENPVAVFGVANDITEQKERERRLQRQNNQFDALASAMSHDLQTPLETARGRAELAVETGETEHMKKSLDALERANELREDLVRVLRSREIINEIGSVDIEQIGESAWESVATTDKASIRIQETFGVKADPDALQRLFENLFSNAIEHAGQDITVRVGKIDTGFFVEDNGPGIPEDKREKVLTPGYSTKGSGSGVGLASVRQIVMAHDWEIHITESSEGGTRIEFTGVEFAG
jgi:PAS domain S-box-containing protein